MPQGTGTTTGAARAITVPSPSCPNVLSPQHRNVPSVLTAQVWGASLPPALVAFTPDDSPDTATGVLLAAVPPLPSDGEPLLPPQHLAAPDVVTAHDW